jgi:predicted outer membrane repeat protein
VVAKLKNCLFSNGVATQGGAIYLSGLSTLEISKSVFYNNYAATMGGALFV